MRRVGDDRSEVAQPMHGLDVDADVRREVPRGADVCGQVTGRERYRSPVVDVDPVRRRRGKFVPVERGVGACDDRPRVRVGGRFAGEVRASSSSKAASMSSGSNTTRAAIRLSASISTMPSISASNASVLVAAREADTSEGEALPAGRNDGRRRCSRPDLGDRSHVRDVDISTVSDPGVHDPTAIVDENVVGQYLRHARPSRGPRSTSRSARPLGLPRFPAAAPAAEFVEPRERGVEVCLVEDFAAVDQVAFDRHDVDRPATRRRSPLARSHAAAWVTTAPRSLSRCTASMWKLRSGVSPTRHGCTRSDHRRECCRPPVVDVDPVRRRRGEFVPVERGVGLAR